MRLGARYSEDSALLTLAIYNRSWKELVERAERELLMPRMYNVPEVQIPIIVGRGAGSGSKDRTVEGGRARSLVRRGLRLFALGHRYLDGLR